jgi:hypothetical protein
MRTHAAILLSAVMLFGVSAASAQIPNPNMPIPNTAVSPVAPWSWPPVPLFPLSPPLPYFTSPPIVNWRLCPGDVVTAFAVYFCGELPGGPPFGTASPFIFPTPAASSTAASVTAATVFVPPVGCVSFTGGPCVTLCRDGQWSSSTGSGTCNSHGGEAVVTTTSTGDNSVPSSGCVSITGGPCVTLCADGTWSSSTGSGTCSSHCGEARLHPNGCSSRPSSLPDRRQMAA